MPRFSLCPRGSHLLCTVPQRQQCNTNTRPFHTCSVRHDTIEAPDCYTVLELPYTASKADIKRQFYSLSKRHHPDRNKGDPSSASRFVRISEAYRILGSPERRTRYDRNLARTQNRTAPLRQHDRDEASYVGPAGSRPPSGLSRRRTQFRGPPPSFYRNGAWGMHAAKRAATGASDDPSSGANAHTWTASRHDGRSSFFNNASCMGDSYSSSTTGGFGPDQAERGTDDVPPHWDRLAHQRTHESIAARVAWRARAKAESTEEMKNGGGPWSLLLNFFAVSGAIAVVASIPGLFNRRSNLAAEK